jgi:hypothetical protein
MRSVDYNHRNRRGHSSAQPRISESQQIVIRGGSGLGDSIYVQGVARYFCQTTSKPIIVRSKWRDVFLPLKDRVVVHDFSRLNVTRIAHYSNRRQDPRTNQWEDCCIQAGLAEPFPLKLDWIPTTGWGAELATRANGKPIVVVQLPRRPMDRVDGWGAELLPDCSTIQDLLDMIQGKAYVVQVGAGAPLYQFKGLDLDLAGHTTVAEVIDIVQAAALCLGYVSFMVPLAEALGKPLMCVWSERGLNSKLDLVRALKPLKIFSAASSRFVVDGWHREQRRHQFGQFFEQATSQGGVQGEDRSDSGVRPGLIG